MRVDIPSSGTLRSIPEEIFRAVQSGNMSAPDGHVAHAAWVADNIWKYPPAVYTPLPEVVWSYAQARNNGKRDREPMLAGRLGGWLYEVRRSISENESDVELVVWCIEQLERVRMDSRIAKLRELLTRFERNSFPTEVYRVASTVQKLDSESKRREARHDA